MVSNWLGNISHTPGRKFSPTCKEQIQAILRDPDNWPTPVRASGANHSVTPVAVADTGTFLDMSEMNRIDAPVTTNGVRTITAEAGASYIKVAKILRGRRQNDSEPFEPGCQFFVNCEIGSLTMGAAASGATKDSAFFPSEYGQVGSYVKSVKLVKPDGELLTVDETTPEPWSLQAVRSGYGLLGVIYEVTIEVKHHTIMKVWHEEMDLRTFLERLPEFNAFEGSVFSYMFPYEDRIVLEFRTYPDPNAHTGETSPWLFALRNFAWQFVIPEAGALTDEFSDLLEWVPGIPGLERMKSATLEEQHRILRAALVNDLHSDHTSPTDQIVDFRDPPLALQRFGFSMWAFQCDSFPEVLTRYFEFCQDYFREHGYCTTMPHVSYRITKDQNSLLSYSWDSDVWTLDPASAAWGDDKVPWDAFLTEFNELCSHMDGKPLFNQTPCLTKTQVDKAYSARWTKFADLRKQCDPRGRLLNQYFRGLLPP
jgi:hypothetical protein